MSDAVIEVRIEPADLESRRLSELAARVRHAQADHPGAEVLVSVEHARVPLSAHEAGCLLVFVAQIESARLCETLVLDEVEPRD